MRTDIVSHTNQFSRVSRVLVPCFSFFLFFQSCAVEGLDELNALREEQVQADEQPIAPVGSTNAQSTTADTAPIISSPVVSEGHKLQQGPWYPEAWSNEEPFINVLHASPVEWYTPTRNTETLYKEGYLSDVTGLPVALPGGEVITSDVYFSAENGSEFYDDNWVLEWEGDADVTILNFKAPYITQVNANRVEFTRDKEGGNTPGHVAIRITQINSPLTNMRLFRADYEDELDAGKIVAPHMAEQLRKGHVVRMMDLQRANETGATSIDHIATMDAVFWGNHINTSKTAAKNANHPFTSMPLEAVFRVGVETDTEIWHHAPIALGADRTVREFLRSNGTRDAKAFTQYVHGRTLDVLASSEWDRYADAFVAAMEAAGYPNDRIVYTTLDNEVWNFVSQFYLSTRYAAEIGRHFDEKSRSYRQRQGYGILMARWAMAVEDALARANRQQEIVYVVESQAANVSTSSSSLAEMQSYIESNGRAWSDYAASTGVSVAFYWGSRCPYYAFDNVAPAVNAKFPYADSQLQSIRARWDAELLNNPNNISQAVADCVLNGSSDIRTSLAYILENLEGHDENAREVGARFIGAYEGGSHLIRPDFFDDAFGNDEALVEWYESDAWEEYAGDVNRQVNQAIIDRFPGVIIANYVIIGPTGQLPWFDGLWGQNSFTQQSWQAFERPAD